MALGAEAGCEGDSPNGSCLSKACLLAGGFRGSVTPTAVGAGFLGLSTAEDWTGIVQSAGLAGRLPADVNEAHQVIPSDY